MTSKLQELTLLEPHLVRSYTEDECLSQVSLGSIKQSQNKQRKASRALFRGLCVLTSPVLVPSGWRALGGIENACRKGMSTTAVLLLLSRVIWHILGDREDNAAIQLAGAVPGIRLRAMHLYFGIIKRLEKASGYRHPQMHIDANRGMRSIMGLRAVTIDHAVEKAVRTQGLRQLVVFAAGFDVTSQSPCVLDRIEEEPGSLCCFEIDKPEAQEIKQTAVREAGLPTGHVTFVSSDLSEGDWLEKAIASGLDPDLRTIILWEGGTYYLPRNVVHGILASFRRKFTAGSQIIFDFPLTNRVAESVLVWLECIGESWLFDLHGNTDSVESCTQIIANFVAGAGLNLVNVEFIEQSSAQLKSRFAGCAVAQVPL